MSRPRALRALALAAALLLTTAGAGCATAPSTGPVSPPEIYPDRSTAPAAFQTFLWAWQRGDVEILDPLLGAWLHYDLERRLEAEGPEATAEFFRKDAAGLELLEVEWIKRGDALAYIRVVLSSESLARTELIFSLVRRPDGWAVYARRHIR